jgi:predicted ATPase
MGNLSHIKIKGFKSIKALDLKMKPINVLIGANGAGKSNFISVFKLLLSTEHLHVGLISRY